MKLRRRCDRPVQLSLGVVAICMKRQMARHNHRLVVYNRLPALAAQKTPGVVALGDHVVHDACAQSRGR